MVVAARLVDEGPVHLDDDLAVAMAHGPIGRQCPVVSRQRLIMAVPQVVDHAHGMVATPDGQRVSERLEARQRLPGSGQRLLVAPHALEKDAQSSAANRDVVGCLLCAVDLERCGQVIERLNEGALLRPGNTLHQPNVGIVQPPAVRQAKRRQPVIGFGRFSVVRVVDRQIGQLCPGAAGQPGTVAREPDGFPREGLGARGVRQLGMVVG